MGQAAVDLPDPLETPPSQAGAPEGAAAGADELLAQMAGQEIDRLLADADVEPEPAPAPAPLTPAGVARALEAKAPEVASSPSRAHVTNERPPASPVAPPDPNADLLPDVHGLEAANPGSVPPGAIAAETGASPLSRSHIPVGPNTSATEDAAVAELFDQLTGGIGGGMDGAGATAPDGLASSADPSSDGAARAAPESAASTTGPAAEAAHVGPPSGVPSPATDPDVFEMTAAERAALEAPLPASDDPLDAQPALDELPAEPSLSHHVAAPAAEGEGPAPIFQYERVPFIVRLLEWINAPFDALPDGARNAIGKVAVMTLVNAVAILIYVLFFRH